MASQSGFTITEVLVSMTVLAIVLVVALNAVSNVGRDQIVNNLRIQANQTARKAVMLIHDDLQNSGYQVNLPSSMNVGGQPLPPVVQTATSPYRLTLRCVRRPGHLLAGVPKGATSIEATNAAEFAGLKNGLILISHEGVTQALRITHAGSKLRFDYDPLAIDLPAGAWFAAVDVIEYNWSDSKLVRTINGVKTDEISGITGLELQFVLDDGTVTTQPSAAEAAKVRYADCSLSIQTQKRMPGGRIYAASSSTSQRIALLNKRS